MLPLLPRRLRPTRPVRSTRLLALLAAALLAVALAPVAPAAASGAPPVAVADSVRVAEGATATALQSGTLSVLGNDDDPEGDPLVAVLTSNPDHGTLTLNPDGTFRYDHDGSETAGDSFTYRAFDGLSLSSGVTVSIDVTPVNDAPVAVDDSYTVAEGQVLTVTATRRLTLNDTDAEGTALVAALESATANGTVVLNVNGTLTYTPDAGFFGVDQFTYRASDGMAVSNAATVEITVIPVNDSPVAVADSLSVPEGGTATQLAGGVTSVLANDTDPEGGTLSAVLVTGPSRGSLTLNADGTFSYGHDGSETTSDSFAYRATDGDQSSAPVTVSITVTPVNDAPVAVGDAIEVAMNGTATRLVGGASSLLANDVDVEGDPLIASIDRAPQHGTLVLNGNGTFGYSPVTGYTGPDSFRYRAGDSSQLSNAATVTITVGSPDPTPVAVADALTVAEGGTATVLSSGATSVLANDSDADGDPLTAVLVAGPAHGTLTLNPNGTFGYTHDGSETTGDSFTYRTSDGTTSSDPVAVTITVTAANDAPVASPDALTVAEGGTATTLTGGATSVLADDGDPEGDALTAELVNAPSSGTLRLDADGTFAYVHDGSETTSDAFTYRTTDGLRFSDVVTVAVTVTPVDDAPLASDDAAQVAEGGTVTALLGGAASVLADDVDAEGDVLTAVLVSGPSSGALTLRGDGTFSYVHDGGESPSDSFTYRASDGARLSDTATVRLTVTPVNDAPSATADSYTTPEDTPLSVPAAAGVSANDTDAEGDDLRVVLGSAPAHGALRLAADGSFTFTPAAGASGPDSFTYRTSDGAATSAPATVSLSVTPVDDAPTVTGLGDRVMKDGGRAAVAFVVGDDSTPVADLQVTAAGDDADLFPRGALEVTGSGADRVVHLAPPAGRSGTARITVTVADAAGARTTGSLTVTVLRARPCTLTGTAGDDVLVGTPGRDVICAGGGDDVLRGLGGHDVLRGAGGDDRILGGAGRDVLVGRGGDDVLLGGDGQDRLLGGPGTDVLRGGPGRDTPDGRRTGRAVVASRPGSHWAEVASG